MKQEQLISMTRNLPNGMSKEMNFIVSMIDFIHDTVKLAIMSLEIIFIIS